MMIFDIEFSHYIICGVGAFTLYFKLKSDGKAVIGFLPYISNKRWVESSFGKLLEAILFTILGSFIGTILTQPINPQQAISAGLGWTGLLAAAAKP